MMKKLSNRETVINRDNLLNVLRNAVDVFEGDEHEHARFRASGRDKILAETTKDIIASIEKSSNVCITR